MNINAITRINGFSLEARTPKRRQKKLPSLTTQFFMDEHEADPFASEGDARLCLGAKDGV